MNFSPKTWLFGPLLVFFFFSCTPQKERSQPNVLFIALDDMNDWTTLFSANNPIKTPNLEKLAQQGVFFKNAYCNAPSCNPSRFSILSGKLPSTTGVYANNSHWKAKHKGITLLPGYFKDNGYETYCAGKIFHHHDTAYYAYEVFDEFLPFKTKIPDNPMPETNLNGVQVWHSPNGDSGKVSPNFDWGVWPPQSEKHIDNKTVKWATEKLSNLKQSNNPFFMAVGIFRPHMPFFVPEGFMEKYPLDKLTMPIIKENDLADLPKEGYEFMKRPWYRWISTFEFESARDSLIFEKAIQAYQAASSFADYQVGELLTALQETGLSENTIIVLWSDHGYHLGEKEHWEKFALYEKATHIPFIVAGPGIKKGKTPIATVSLIDVFPTLVDLCGLPKKEDLDGHSLTKLLSGEVAEWDEPALMTFEQGNHAIRHQNYRYIHYKNGGEEFYDLSTDPHEWDNLANDNSYSDQLQMLKKFLPQENASPVPAFNKSRVQVYK